jgi:peptide/nickel transport system permease protein
MRRPVLGVIGGAVVVLILAAALLAPALAPYPEAQSVGGAWEPASVKALIGTDQIGRDLLTRLLYGARLTIALALATTLVAMTVGVAIGLAAAVAGGWVDAILSRLVDVILSIPLLIFALIILGVFGASTVTLILTVGLLDAPRVARVARALARGQASLDYVEAARLRGEGALWIMTKEILPNIAQPLEAEAALRFCFGILLIASLSFLGLGVQPPAADWGGMVRENAAAIGFGLMAPVYPAAAIALLTVAINLAVDGFSARRRP